MSQCLPSGEEWIFQWVPDRREVEVNIDFPSGKFVTDQHRLTFSLLNYLSLSLSLSVQAGILERPGNGQAEWSGVFVREWNREECSKPASSHSAQQTHIDQQIKIFS